MMIEDQMKSRKMKSWANEVWNFIQWLSYLKCSKINCRVVKHLKFPNDKIKVFKSVIRQHENFSAAINRLLALVNQQSRRKYFSYFEVETFPMVRPTSRNSGHAVFKLKFEATIGRRGGNEEMPRNCVWLNLVFILDPPTKTFDQDFIEFPCS